MIETNHIHNQVSDYVLGLLPSDERRQVEEHAVTCDACRQAIRQESRVGKVVRDSLARISPPEKCRLNQLMPQVPTQRQLRWRLLWQRQMAPACIGLLILLGSWGLWQSSSYSAWTNSGDDLMVVTATMTDIPTATLAQTESADIGRHLGQRATTVPSQPDAAATPAPNPTPIAAATQVAANH